MMGLRIGTAGWSIPRAVSDRFPPGGSVLERYARGLSCVEINSSFHRPHRRATYERWAASVPAAFRFAVKVPKVITHEKRLADVAGERDRFLDEIAGLAEKRGPLLVQLPPSLRFDATVVRGFLDGWRSQFDGDLVCEPRHPSWFAAEADDLLRAFRVARVVADPAPVPAAAKPGGLPHLRYLRLHGAPRIYYSAYGDERLAQLAADFAETRAPVWCIFDNTALGEACANALDLSQRASNTALCCTAKQPVA